MRQNINCKKYKYVHVIDVSKKEIYIKYHGGNHITNISNHIIRIFEDSWHKHEGGINPKK